jgi:hypothetical protein
VLALRATIIAAATIVFPKAVVAANTPVSCRSNAAEAISCCVVSTPRNLAPMTRPAFRSSRHRKLTFKLANSASRDSRQPRGKAM